MYFRRNVVASGVMPQISVIMGPCAGGDVYSPAMTDFIFMVKNTSYMFVTGPDVVKTVTNEVVTAEELGGASVHATRSSIADGAFENDVETLLQMRRLIDFLPSNNTDGVPEWPSFDDIERVDMSLDTLIPDHPNKPYDMKELILKVVDEGDFFEISEPSPKISSPDLAASPAAPQASSPTSRWCWPACSTPMPRARRRALFASATPSIFRSSPSLMCRASCRAPSGKRRADQAQRQTLVRLFAMHGAAGHRSLPARPMAARST